MNDGKSYFFCDRRAIAKVSLARPAARMRGSVQRACIFLEKGVPALLRRRMQKLSRLGYDLWTSTLGAEMSVTTKVPDFSWITAAPIRVLRPPEVHARLEAFRANIASWYGEKGADTQWEPDAGATKEWNERKEAMQTMIWWPFNDSDVVAEYRIDGAPVALIGLKTYNKTNRIAVHGLVSHPGAALGGAIMIEWAVNHAKERWGTINLYLHSLDDESTKFYRKIGFVEDDLADKPGPDELKLEPASSDKWIGLSDGWKLKEYAGLRYRSDHTS